MSTPTPTRGPNNRLSSYRAIENLIATYAELVDDGDFAGGRHPARRRHLHGRRRVGEWPRRHREDAPVLPGSAFVEGQPVEGGYEVIDVMDQ